MSLMSSPRCATSVAANTGWRPSLNSCSTQSRSSCDLSPWIARQGQPSTRSSRVRLSHRRFELQKMRIFEPSISASSSPTSLPSFAGSLHTSTCCAICVFALPAWTSAPPTSRRRKPGSRKVEASACTSAGHVAENMSVCRSGRICWSSPRSCGTKPRSSIRSASSTTTYVHRESSVFFLASSSVSRPGVATTTSGALRSASTCGALGTPPWRHTELTPHGWPKRTLSSWICTASSRVGARMTQRGSARPCCGGHSAASNSPSIWCSTGKRNAPVLPEPV
mmetsp:Transcript_7082/g.15455  ORF Transcript_7082/g.15455 Transcript_7082/m.15455 type:complete len:280 (+) Transcript_7082:318-1157(+)